MFVEKVAWQGSSSTATSCHCLEENSLALSGTETWSNETWNAVNPLMCSTEPVNTLCWILLLGSGVVKSDDTAHCLQPKLSFTSFTALQPLCILVGHYSVTLRNTTEYFYRLILQAFGRYLLPLWPKTVNNWDKSYYFCKYMCFKLLQTPDLFFSSH